MLTPSKNGATADRMFRADCMQAMRERAGLSQADLARLVDVDQATISRLERGQTTTLFGNIRLLHALAEALSIAPQALQMQVDEIEHRAVSPMGIAHGRCALHFNCADWRRWGLADVLRMCLKDLTAIRPEIVRMSVTIFRYDRSEEFVAYVTQPNSAEPVCGYNSVVGRSSLDSRHSRDPAAAQHNDAFASRVGDLRDRYDAMTYRDMWVRSNDGPVMGDGADALQSTKILEYAMTNGMIGFGMQPPFREDDPLNTAEKNCNALAHIIDCGVAGWERALR